MGRRCGFRVDTCEGGALPVVTSATCPLETHEYRSFGQSAGPNLIPKKKRANSMCRSSLQLDAPSFTLMPGACIGRNSGLQAVDCNQHPMNTDTS